jgi:hypothetical protein
MEKLPFFSLPEKRTFEISVQKKSWKRTLFMAYFAFLLFRDFPKLHNFAGHFPKILKYVGEIENLVSSLSVAHGLVIGKAPVRTTENRARMCMYVHVCMYVLFMYAPMNGRMYERETKTAVQCHKIILNFCLLCKFVLTTTAYWQLKLATSIVKKDINVTFVPKMSWNFLLILSLYFSGNKINYATRFNKLTFLSNGKDMMFKERWKY